MASQYIFVQETISPYRYGYIRRIPSGEYKGHLELYLDKGYPPHYNFHSHEPELWDISYLYIGVREYRLRILTSHASQAPAMRLMPWRLWDRYSAKHRLDPYRFTGPRTRNIYQGTPSNNNRRK